MALLGFGSRGAILAAYPKILEKGVYRLLVIVSLLSGILIVAALFIFARYPLQPGALYNPIKFSIPLITDYVCGTAIRHWLLPLQKRIMWYNYKLVIWKTPVPRFENGYNQA